MKSQNIEAGQKLTKAEMPRWIALAREAIPHMVNHNTPESQDLSFTWRMKILRQVWNIDARIARTHEAWICPGNPPETIAEHLDILRQELLAAR